eukprot:scaffold149720_cov18-Prasinocladus_malaysianus.AAC.1
MRRRPLAVAGADGTASTYAKAGEQKNDAMMASEIGRANRSATVISGCAVRRVFSASQSPRLRDHTSL